MRTASWAVRSRQGWALALVGGVLAVGAMPALAVSSTTYRGRTSQRLPVAIVISGDRIERLTITWAAQCHALHAALKGITTYHEGVALKKSAWSTWGTYGAHVAGGYQEQFLVRDHGTFDGLQAHPGGFHRYCADLPRLQAQAHRYVREREGDLHTDARAVRSSRPAGLAATPMPDLISIIDADSDLADLLSPAERERARREALTRVRRLSVGEWQAAEAIEPDVHHRGFLVIDGLISREVEVLGRRACRVARPRRRAAALALGSRRLPRPRRGGLEGARADAPGRVGPGPDRADGTVAAARARVIRPRHAAGALARHRSGHCPSPACR